MQKSQINIEEKDRKSIINEASTVELLDALLNKVNFGKIKLQVTDTELSRLEHEIEFEIADANPTELFNKLKDLKQQRRIYKDDLRYLTSFVNKPNSTFFDTLKSLSYYIRKSQIETIN